MGLDRAALLPSDARIGGSPLHRLDSRAKIIGFIGFVVVVVTTPARSVWAFVLYAAVLLFLVGLGGLNIGRVLQRTLVIVPFLLVVAVFLPFFQKAGAGSYSLGGAHVTGEGLLVLWNVGAKAVLSILSVTVLGATTPFAELVLGFERLGAPKVFVLIVSFMYRYSFVFVDEAQRMRRAMTSRNYRARWLWNVPVLGHMLGALFLRSYGRGERVYVAMLSRGYEGAIPLSERAAFRLPEASFLGAILVVTVTIRVAASLWGAS
jgi:cobalt/nickel transport system permease protein